MSKQNHYDKILSAALTLFHERGFHNTGTQDVVDLAGVSKGSFYNHFKSKDALGLAVLEFYWEQHSELLALLKNSGTPALKRIENYLNALGYNKRGCLVGNFSIELSESDTFRQRISELFKIWVSKMAVCISDGQKDGSIRNNQAPENLSEFVISSLEGAILRTKIERDPNILDRFRYSTCLFLKNT